MKSLFNRKRSIFFFFLSFGTIAILLLYYYLVYIPKSQTFVLEQNFRILKTTGSILVDKVKAYQDLIDTYSKLGRKKESGSGTKTAQGIKKLLDEQKIFSKHYVDSSNTEDPNFQLFRQNKITITEWNDIEFYDTLKNEKIVGSFPLENFLSAVFNNKSFTGYFLAADNKIVLDGTNLGLSVEKFLQESKLDTLFYHSNQATIKIKGASYRVFATPLPLFMGKNQVVIGAFVSESKIQAQINMVNPYLVISIFLVVCLALLLLPAFKIWVLSKRDMLNLSDVTAMYVSAYLLVAVLSLWFLFGGKDTFSSQGDLSLKKDPLLDSVSKSIVTDFIDTEKYLNGILDIQTLPFPSDTNKLDLRKAFWVDSTGKMNGIRNIIAHEDTINPVKPNLKNRAYFTQVYNNSKTIAIDPVISRSDGKIEIVFAKRSCKQIKDSTEFLVGITMLPRAMRNPILPSGIQIALIDKSGKVIMHSDSTKNMVVNLADELKNPYDLQQALLYGKKSLFSTTYMDQRCEIHVKPLDGYPEFFVVRITDKSIEQEIKTKAMLLTSCLLLFILILVFFITYLIYSAATKTSIRQKGNLYLQWGYPQPKYKNLYKTLSIGGFIIILIFIGSFMALNCKNSHFTVFSIVWLLLAIPFFLAPFFGIKILNIIKKWIPLSIIPEFEFAKTDQIQPIHPGYARWYSNLVFVKLCFFSLLPAWFIFTYAHHHFKEKQNKKALFEFSNQWFKRDGKLNLAVVGVNVFPGNIGVSYSRSELQSENSNYFFDFIDSMFFKSEDPSTSISYSKHEQGCEDNKNIKNIYNTVIFKSSLSYSGLPVKDKWYSAFWFYFWFIVGLLLISELIHRIIERIFGVSTPGYLPNAEAIENRLKYLLSEKCLTNFIFLQGLTSSYKSKMLKRVLDKIPAFQNDKNNEIVEVDLLEIPDEQEFGVSPLRLMWDEKINKILNSTDYKLIIVKHFEYNYEDRHTNQIKLNLMEKLTLKTKCKLVITSAIDPTSMLESLHETGNISDKQKTILVEDVHRWNVLLGKFVNIVVSIHKGNAKDYNRSFQYELDTNEFLIGIQDLYPNRSKYVDLQNEYLGDKNDAILIDLHQTTIHFYRDIWHSLMPEEKVMLFDLAEEGLLNSTNYTTLYGLICKGLIVRTEGIFYLINSSFRQFILTSVTKADLENAMEKIGESSIWKDSQGPILLMIAALLWFILYANQEQFGQVFPLITAMATGLPTILKIFGHFIPNSSK